METSLPPCASNSSPSACGLQREVRVLRLALSLTLVSLVILSGSLGAYLYRQDALLRRQVEVSNRASSQALQHYKEQVEPKAVAFEQELMLFARSNADFQVRIGKYFPNGFSSPPGSATGPGRATNAPAVAGALKP